MLGSMSDELQRQHEDIETARQMLAHLQEMFGEQSRTTKYQVMKRLFKTKMHDG
ncbi:putative Retrovirus-related Pol polyprotein from transposon TNT 1-94 [Cocos nucifera]|nr:putative Retrovirus-related Pol polyprotein from transposon TNT 1-94 [Cocos nucifera]